MDNWWETRSALEADIFSGHKKITFEAEEENEDAEPFVFGGEIDLVLIADNRIVASTAGSGRYAVGSLFFARDAHRYADLYQACCADTTPCALLHVRGVAIFSGAWLTDSGTIPAMILHGNTKRTLRVLKHCFGDVIRRIDDPEEIGGLRHDDRPCYRLLLAAWRQFCRLLRGAGRTLTVETRTALTTVTEERVRSLWHMLGLSPVQLDTENLPFPCEGTINITRTSAILLCLGLWLCRRTTALPNADLRMAPPDPLQFGPCFVIPLSPRESAAWRAEDLPPELAAATRLASFDRALFSCELPPNAQQLLVRFSPLCPSRQELYVLRARPALENDKFT